MESLCKRSIGLWSTALLFATSALAGALPDTPAHFEQDGLRVEMQAAPLESSSGHTRLIANDTIHLRFRVAEDGGSGKAVSGLRPLAWMTKRSASSKTPTKEECKKTIRGLLGGRLARKAEVNLNEYLLITLDDNNSISIIDPQIESSKTKTLGMVSLSSKGSDFALAPDRRTVLVTLENQGRVAAVDIFSHRARYLEVGGHPHRITVQPDGRLAWIGDKSGRTVSVLDIDTLTVAAVLEVGTGPHHFAFGASSALSYVSSAGSTTVSVVDTHSLALRTTVEVGGGALAAGYSKRSGQVYVARIDGTIIVIDGRTQTRVTTIDLREQLASFALSPNGRFAFAILQHADTLAVIDTATNEVIQRIPTLHEPDRIEFSDSFAYLRHAGTGEYLLVELNSLSRESEPVVTPVMMGQRPPSGIKPSIAPSIVPLPEGGGVLALSSADRAIAHFMEGMNAPMGSYQTYPWPARGLLISDRTIQETDDGEYETEFRLPGAGTYTLPFLVPTSPQLYGCFTLEVTKPEREAVAQGLALEPMFDSHQPFAAGASQPLAVRLINPDDGSPVEDLDDVMILVLGGPRSQWRGRALSVGDGRYQANVRFPQAGQYLVMVASASRGVGFGELRSLVARAEIPRPQDSINTARR